MEYTWDDNKNRTNVAKHGVSFELAVQVFDDPLHKTTFDCIMDFEERWHAIGTTKSEIILLVVHTFREHNSEEYIRIISARKATPNERRQYEDGLYPNN